MAFTGNFMCTSFKQELLVGIHNFTASSGDTFKLALYTNSASFTAATTAYTATNEVANSGSYSAGTTALTDFADLDFTDATITARGALIYNSSAAGNPTVAVLDFGADKTSTNSTFGIQFPTADASNAIIRIA